MSKTPAREVIARRFDSLFNALTGFGGLGDKGAASRPNLWVQDLTMPELEALWRHNGIARRIVSLLPREATRRGWDVPDITTEDDDLKIHERVRQAMTWARLWGGSILLPVTEDDIPMGYRNRPGDWLMQPLEIDRIGKVHALQVFDAFDAQPGPICKDIRSPQFRQPEWWTITTEGSYFSVHASRVLHFRGAERPPSRRGLSPVTPMPDDPVLQSIWDEVRRLGDTMAGGAVLAAEIRESVLRIGNLDKVAVGDQAAALEERAKFIAKAKGLLNMVILGKEDAYENRSNPPTGFRELSDAAKSMLAAVVGWPIIVLFGDTPAGFSTDGASGWQTFNRLVANEQEENRYLLELLYRIIYAAQDGPTQGRQPDRFTLKFRPLDEPTEKGKADAYAQVAQADAIYIDRGVLEPADVRRHRFGSDAWQVEMTGLEDLPEDQSYHALTAELRARAINTPGVPDAPATKPDGE